MAATSKFPIIDRKIVFGGNGVFSPETRARAFAQAASESIVEIDRANDAAAGHDVSYKTFVDGRETSNLFAAKESSTIVARWELGEGVVAYIADLLHQAGPVKSADAAGCEGKGRRCSMRRPSLMPMNERKLTPEEGRAAVAKARQCRHRLRAPASPAPSAFQRTC